MSTRALTLLAALGASAPALATDGLAWRWDDDGHRYLLQTEIELAQPLWFRAEQNVDVRVVSFSVDLLTRCRPESTRGKRGWDLRCDIEDVRIDATPVEQGRLEPVLDEMDAKLLDATVQLTFLADGRVRAIDLEGVDKSNRRLQAIFEVMRLVLARTYAGLDLQLPRGGDDGGEGVWTQNTPLAMHQPSTTGAVGKVVVEHALTDADAPRVTLRSTGQGTLGTGDTMAVDGQEQPTNLFEMTYQGDAVFDRSAGHLVERSFLVEGTPTASSVMAEAGGQTRYAQQMRVTWVGPDQEVPGLGPNAERPR